ncbi:HMG-CoA reductase [Histoplasma capsulatum H143]|uniref:HMG-CoA reductase n=1 Tax=Ajellomyces capsulatus (strain H143) TaxID=544712 RepID=C6H9K8_AJECH|nr:HMG-CoA reductase [Histoplasma capsulatum H143]
MKAARSSGSGSRRVLRIWLTDAWNSFVDLLKHAETVDIIIMVLGYISMHLTFVSLFLSMRRLGSQFWLATTVLFSGVFAFLFGLLVTTKLGVPINMLRWILAARSRLGRQAQVLPPPHQAPSKAPSNSPSSKGC